MYDVNDKLNKQMFLAKKDYECQQSQFSVKDSFVKIITAAILINKVGYCFLYCIGSKSKFNDKKLVIGIALESMGLHVVF